MKLGAVREVAGADALRCGEFPEFGEFVGVRLLVDAVNGWLLPGLEFAGDELIGEEHEFIDELVGNVVLHPLESHGAAGFVEPDLDFRKLEIERSCGEAFFRRSDESSQAVWTRSESRSPFFGGFSRMANACL